MKRVISQVLLILLLVGTFTSAFSIKTAMSSNSGLFNDEFNSSALDSRWTLVDPDGGSTFDLTANPGWLRISTISPPGRDLYANVQNAPHIMQSGIEGNFTVETKVMATTDENDEGAGILVWKSSHDHLRFERMSRTIGNPVEQQIVLGVEGGEWTKITLSSSVNPTYLKLIRSNQLFSGYYSSDGVTWYHVGDVTYSSSDPVDVGLDIINMYHDGTFIADFDYFRIYTSGCSWWNRDWQHRTKVNLTENSGCDLSNFPVDVTFRHNGNVQTNGEDIRVVDNSVEIPSFVEECNGTHAKVILETNISAFESKIVYVYYGNPSALAPDYPLVPLTILEGNTGHAIIDNRIYIGWDYTSWGCSNPVELWNDFRIDFNRNGDPTDDDDLIRDYDSRQGGIGRHRADLSAIGLGDYQNYVQTPIYVDVCFADAKLRVYKKHPWVETTQADFLFMFSPSYTYANYGGGTEQNIIDGLGTNGPELWNLLYLSKENPGWMAFRDDTSGDVFVSTGLVIGNDYAYLQSAKETSDWDRVIDYSNRSRYDPLDPYDQPSECRIYWYGDNSNNYTEIEKIATTLNNQPIVTIVPDTIIVPNDFLSIQETIDHANEGDTVFVRNETYYENVVVNRTISLVGENKDTTIIDGNGTGYVLVSGNNSLVSNFTIRNNGYVQFDYGVLVCNSRIYHNNFIDNQYQGEAQELNAWDNGYEGNYWNDYNGTDSNGDGIGDTPYVIDFNDQDNYPLMNPYWNPADVNHDLTVDIKDIYLCAKAYGSYLEGPNPIGHPWNPHCDINEDGKVSVKDFYKICKNYGKTYP